MPNYAQTGHYESFIRKQTEAEREKWLRSEIPPRFAELRQDPAKGVAADKAFSELEARHRANLAKDK